MKVIVVGAGYVGLVTGCCLAVMGNEVVVVDKDYDKIQHLRKGVVPIYEPGLSELIAKQTANGRLSFSMSYPKDEGYLVSIIAVGTPSHKNGSADLSAVFGVVGELAELLPDNGLIITKSTVPVGTGAEIKARLKDFGRDDIQVASAPEFLREGTAIQDTLEPHRLVFGSSRLEAIKTLRELHRGIQAPIVECDCETAEMIKYASNAFLATKITFINEISNICERTGADVIQVAKGMGLDPRISPHFLKAGLGYGGSCFPKDTKALLSIAGSVDYEFLLIEAVIEQNRRQRFIPIDQLNKWFGSVKGKRITLLGLAFKPETDDIRESPALDLYNILVSMGASVTVCDPIVHRFLDENGLVVNVIGNPYEALKGADAGVLVTEWKEFGMLDWGYLSEVMRQKYVFDGRNFLDLEWLGEMGFEVRNFGRKANWRPYKEPLPARPAEWVRRHG